MSSQDEDLLDLMVRIAETPEEWERIHRVLSLIGREKEAYETTENNLPTDDLNEVIDMKNLTDNDFESEHKIDPTYNITVAPTTEVNMLTSTTPPLLTTTPETATTGESQDTQSGDMDDTDTGWPDFEEAIVKKVKKSHPVDENDILESNWLEDDWLDPKWNSFLSSKSNKDQAEHISNKNSVGVTPLVSGVKTNSEKSEDVPRSRLYRDPKILEFHLKDVVSFRNHTVEHNSSEDSNSSSSHEGRPMFVYHRVTTSPQERRGNAFIAVSVVRQSVEESPSTTLSPHTFWDQIRRIQTPAKDSLLKRERKNWRQEVHWKHNRGRRHHHAHTHTHQPTHH
ncbi:uncharacterized protein LOC129003078 isoform X2 [Macrosteles quadrilineatus]|nr:uncharacterized protein LOC129003078 isoform X2 [Macrosteles quadrilineatus]